MKVLLLKYPFPKIENAKNRFAADAAKYRTEWDEMPATPELPLPR
jgi:hypothetical protein